MVVCAIGDIHGRLDLLASATDELRRAAQLATSEGQRFITIFLGDYVDRGPDSKGVIDHLIAFDREAPGERVFLRGNHEQTILDLADEVEDGLPWLEYGGVETLASYGVHHLPKSNGPAATTELGRLIRAAIPEDHLNFLRATELYAKCGDYLFVHAGLRPDRLMDEQSAADMLWFRYYADEPPVHGEFVIHGHSTNERPILGRWRIGIDTEAYATGDLTILRLEGGEREFLRVSTPAPGAPAQVTNWSSIDSSYSRREPRAQTRSATTGQTHAPHGSPRAGALAVVMVVAAAAVAGGLIFAARVAGEGAHPKTPATIGPRPAAAAPAVPPPPPPETPADSGPQLRRPVATPEPPPTQAAGPVIASATPPSPATDKGGARVQIGALDSPQAARRAWDRVAAEFPALMKSKAFDLEQTESGGRTFYRAYVAGFADTDAARQFCRQIGAAEIACIVR